ncbi:MAG: flagellin [Proteobacteria bacterium]|nr:flagellin [Pseudomonadota bacterium]
MSLVLNTNLDSLVAQNSLSSSGTQLANALSQLSSGLRINTSADDAAGYAIAQGMTSQINGLNQAAQNANDGVSLTQTATGALGEVTTDLQTMRDLAVESLNASNSSTDRADLNQQFQQLVADINSVASNTQFNGVNLLDGTFQGATFQIGANAGQTITVSSVASAKAGNLGALYAGALTTGGTAGAYLATTTATPPVTNIANGDTVSFSVAVTPAGGTATTVTTNDVTLTGNASSDLATIAAAINQAAASQGVIATVNGTTGITLSGNTANAGGTVAVTVANSTGSIAADATALQDLGIDSSDTIAATGASYLSSSNVTTVDNSNQALVQIDAALQQLAQSTAQLGAYQNRFTALIAGLNTDATNLTSAKSAIVDTDYAQATSNLSKAQILQQASTAMVAQANTIPQNILTLLQKLP